MKGGDFVPCMKTNAGDDQCAMFEAQMLVILYAHLAQLFAGSLWHYNEAPKETQGPNKGTPPRGSESRANSIAHCFLIRGRVCTCKNRYLTNQAMSPELTMAVFGTTSQSKMDMCLQMISGSCNTVKVFLFKVLWLLWLYFSLRLIKQYQQNRILPTCMFALLK